MRTWQRPNTTRTYLHPPKSERMVTLWREGKLMLGLVELAPGPTVPKYSELISFGLWPVYGEVALAADFKTADFSVREDGAPVHTITNAFGPLQVRQEAFCDTERKTSAYVGFTVTNGSDKPEKFGLMLRIGLESKLIFDGPDVYKSYAPDIQVWKETPATWKKQGDLLRDGEAYLKLLEGDGDFEEATGILWLTVQPRQTQSLTLQLGLSQIPENTYAAQKRQTLAFYEKELSRLEKLPENMDAAMAKNLVVQLLQCFAAPVDTDLLMCRQGGLQRRIWPFEAMYALEALDRLGSFDDYIEPVIDLYFRVMQDAAGEVVPLGLYWAMATAVSIYSFADHALRKDKAFYDRYREQVMAGFDFIKNTRVRASEDPGVVVGLFPPKRSCDAVNVLQAWTLTDSHNVIGLKKLAEAAEAYNDPRAEEIRGEYVDYRKAIQGCFDRAKGLAGNDGPIVITNYVPGVGGDETLHPFAPHDGIIAAMLELEQEEIDRIMLTIEARGSRHEGLYKKMPDHYRMKDADGIVRMWYTTLDEYYWFEAFLRLGQKDRCLEILDSIYKYSMTPEYHMVERYHPHDPWFVPWSPNASANGRLLIMNDILTGK